MLNGRSTPASMMRFSSHRKAAVSISQILLCLKILKKVGSYIVSSVSLLHLIPFNDLVLYRKYIRPKALYTIIQFGSGWTVNRTGSTRAERTYIFSDLYKADKKNRKWYTKNISGFDFSEKLIISTSIVFLFLLF
jgi:hypothetical protein